MDTLISNVTAVTMNEKLDVLFGAYIGVKDGKICYVGKTAPEEQPQTIIDGTGMVAMPGLVNGHTHLTSTAVRFLTDDLSANAALEQQLKYQSRMDHRSAKAAALMGIAECLRFGITSVSDLSEQPLAVAEAAQEAGIKANIAMACSRFVDENEEFDFDTDPGCQMLCDAVNRFHGAEDGRIRIDAGIHAEYTGNYRLWEALYAYAQDKNLRLQLHLSQTEAERESCLDRTGLTPTELLACHHLLDLPTTAAGCNALSEEERAILGKKKASAVALPLTSGKLGYGVMNISQCVKSGMNVALGTGGAADSGNLDLFEVMRAAAGAQRQEAGNAEAMPAAAVLMMATTCGARAQGRADVCGMLKEGMKADIVLVDFTAPHLMPCHNVTSGLVFGAKGSDVALTMVDGKVLYRSGRFETIDLPAVVQELTEYAIPRLLDDGKE